MMSNWKSFVQTLLFGLCVITAASAIAGSPKAGPKAPEVVMYATQTCGYCVKARAYLKSHGVAWQERDIETSAEARKDWQALGGVGTPLILINGKPFVGFTQASLDAELAKYGK